MSYVAGTASNPSNRDHVLVTSEDLQTFLDLGHEIDGIEGFIFPYDQPQPEGTVILYRAFRPVRFDFAVFPAALLDDMEQQGYAGAEPLGYAYPADSDSDFDGLIDGFEALLGTDPDNDDSDCDGIPDGEEYAFASLPVSDPLDGTCAIDADLAVTLTSQETPDGNFEVRARVTNSGPRTAESTKLEVFFFSHDRDWAVQGPFGCKEVPPGLTRDFHSSFFCELGDLPLGSAERTFLITPSSYPSSLSIRAIASTTSPDPNPSNDEANTTVIGGSF